MKDKVINKDSIEFIAADMSSDNEIKALDYIKIKNIMMEKK